MQYIHSTQQIQFKIPSIATKPISSFITSFVCYLKKKEKDNVKKGNMFQVQPTKKKKQKKIKSTKKQTSKLESFVLNLT